MTNSGDATYSSARGARAVSFVVVEGMASLGNALSVFALEIWIYQSTGSYGLFALMTLLGVLPGVLVAPFSGPLVDRLPSGIILLGCSVAVILLSLSFTLALRYGPSSTMAAGWLIIGLATIQTVRWPTLVSTVSKLSTLQNIGRITAFEEAMEASIVIAAPVLGVWLLTHGGILPVVGILSISYLSSIVGVFLFGLPRAIEANHFRSIFNN